LKELDAVKKNSHAILFRKQVKTKNLFFCWAVPSLRSSPLAKRENKLCVFVIVSDIDFCIYLGLSKGFQPSASLF